MKFPAVKIAVYYIHLYSFSHHLQLQHIHKEMTIFTICRDIKGKNNGNALYEKYEACIIS